MQNIGCNVAFVVAAIGKGVEKIVTAVFEHTGVSRQYYKIISLWSILAKVYLFSVFCD